MKSRSPKEGRSSDLPASLWATRIPRSPEANTEENTKEVIKNFIKLAIETLKDRKDFDTLKKDLKELKKNDPTVEKVMALLNGAEENALSPSLILQDLKDDLKQMTRKVSPRHKR